MGKFRYRMQNILELKMKTEEQAKMEFGEAQHALNVEQEKMDELHNRRNKYMEEALELQEGSINVNEILFNRNAVSNIDELIEKQALKIKEAEKVVDKAREKLTRNMQERKMQETLRQKAFEAYLFEEKETENKESDERTSFNYGQKARQKKKDMEEAMKKAKKKR